MVLVLVAFAVLIWPRGEPAGTYVNPVFEPVLADPSVLRHADGSFYAYGTEDDWGDGEGPRAIPILRSRDLVDWEYVGEAFDRRPDWRAGDLWAPDVLEREGRYHLVYSLAPAEDPNPAIGLAIGDHPAGPFDDLAQLFDSRGIGVENSLYPQFFEEDGVPYLVWGSFHGIYLIELSADVRGTAGEPVRIAGDAFEAPLLLKRDGSYWLFLSLGTCCDGLASTYRLAVGRSDELTGPYVDREGRSLMESAGTLLLWEGERFIAPGQATVVTDDAATDWLLYHAVDPEQPRLGSGATRRPLLLDRLRWQDDGWPSVAGMVPSEERQPAPQLKTGDEAG